MDQSASSVESRYHQLGVTGPAEQLAHQEHLDRLEQQVLLAQLEYLVAQARLAELGLPVKLDQASLDLLAPQAQQAVRAILDRVSPGQLGQQEVVLQAQPGPQE